jgi:hypothetical protein
MRRLAALGAVALVACADPLTLTEPDPPRMESLQTVYGDTTLQLYLNPDQSLAPHTSSSFVHLRVLVGGKAVASTQIKARFSSSNTSVIALTYGSLLDDDRTRVYAKSAGVARIDAEWPVGSKVYKTSQEFRVGSSSAAVDTVVQLYLNPDRALVAGDNSVFVHARVLIGGVALSAAQTKTTFTTSHAKVIALPYGGMADDDRTRLYPEASGTARITASWAANGRTYQGSRDYTVGGSTPPPPPSAPPPGAPLVNECSSARPEWIWCDDFDVDRLSGYFEVSTASGRFGRASGVGIQGSHGMRARFDAGTVGAGSLKIAFGKTPGGYIRSVTGGSTKYRDVYWRVFIYYPPGWEGGAGHKVSRATSLVNSNWAQSMIAHIWGGTKHLWVDPASGTDAAGNLRTTKYNDFDRLRWLGARRGNTAVSEPTGVWQCIEARVRLNDAGKSNGIQQMWINGVLEAESRDLNFLGSYADYGINAVFLENYWNSPGAPKTQYRYFDNFVVSTAPIGCGG